MFCDVLKHLIIGLNQVFDAVQVIATLSLVDVAIMPGIYQLGAILIGLSKKFWVVVFRQE